MAVGADSTCCLHVQSWAVGADGAHSIFAGLVTAACTCNHGPLERIDVLKANNRFDHDDLNIFGISKIFDHDKTC